MRIDIFLLVLLLTIIPTVSAEDLIFDQEAADISLDHFGEVAAYDMVGGTPLYHYGTWTDSNLVWLYNVPDTGTMTLVLPNGTRITSEVITYFWNDSIAGGQTFLEVRFGRVDLNETGNVQIEATLQGLPVSWNLPRP